MHIQDLDKRSREIFRQIVEGYLETGSPVGSRTISKIGGLALSPASVRNVMADLESVGLLYAPHTSAGRMPTELGLRLFVDGLLEIGDLTESERQEIEARCKADGRRFEDVLTDAVSALSGLSHCACVVMAPRQSPRIRQIEFVQLAPNRGLVIIVGENGQVENRAIDLPEGIDRPSLHQAANYLNERLAGRTLEEAMLDIRNEILSRQSQLDDLTNKLIEEGIIRLAENKSGDNAVIVRGRANLLEDSSTLEDLERVRQLFEDLETKRDLASLLDTASKAEALKIFIGAENRLFSLSGSSVIAAPYKDDQGKVVGSLGVIGPTRLNYARIIPMVDYTAKIIGRLL